MKFYVTKTKKDFINEKLLDNLFFAHRKIAEKGSVKSLIILTKFILKFGKRFGYEYEYEKIHFDEPIGIDEDD